MKGKPVSGLHGKYSTERPCSRREEVSGRLLFETLEPRIMLSATSPKDADDIYDVSTLPRDVDYAPGELIVALEPGGSFDQLQQDLGLFNMQLVKEIGIINAIVVQFDGGTNIWDMITLFGMSQGVRYAQPNYIISVDATTPNDPDFGRLWGMDNTGQTGGTVDADIDAPEAWDIGTGGGTVVVGVIDTGIDYTHPDLAANMWTNPGEIAGNSIDDDGNGYVDDIYGWDFINNDADPMDDNSHGTHVAGTIGAVGNNGVGVAGVAWNVQLAALKFLGASGSGPTSGALDAVNYAVAMGFNLTNNSWGGGGFSWAMRAAISAAGAAGQVFVAAAGNDTLNNDTNPHYPSSHDLDNVIAVASTDHNDNLSSFSNYGAVSVDLAAPGSLIWSTVPGGGYGYKNGTSMASPAVAGAAALLLSLDGTLSPAGVKSALLMGVDVLPSLAGKVLTGGRLNLFGAIGGLSPVDLLASGDTGVSSIDNVTSYAVLGAAAQNSYYAAPAAAITDNNWTTSDITVADITTVTHVIVSVNITHSYVGDLWIVLRSPAATDVTLVSYRGGPGDDFTATTFDDMAETAIADGTAPFGGRFSPEGQLADFIGETSNGVWQLWVYDNADHDEGTLDSWGLSLGQTDYTYASAPAAAITDLSWTQVTINVPDVFTIADVNVTVDITHTWDSNLWAYLYAPSGSFTELFRVVGGSGDNFTNTTLDDDAAISIWGGAAPFTGRFRPTGSLSFLEGEAAFGTWSLRVYDDTALDEGTINSWSLAFGEPAAGATLDFAVNGTTPGATVDLIADGAVGAPLGTVVATGEVTYFGTVLNTLADGLHAISMRENGGPLSQALYVVIDSAAPAAPVAPTITSAGSGVDLFDWYELTVSNHLEITVAGNPYYRLYRDTGQISGEYEAANPFTYWEATPGQHDFAARAVDAAGNASGMSADAQITVMDTAGGMQLTHHRYNGGMVVGFVDMDLSNGVSMPNIAWSPLQYQPGVTDIMVVPGNYVNRAIYSIILYGDGTNTRDLGIVVAGNTSLGTVLDLRTTATPLSFIYSEGAVNLVQLKSTIVGYNMNNRSIWGSNNTPADLDGDGNLTDLTGIYSGVSIGTVIMRGANVTGEVVSVGGMGLLMALGGSFNGDVTARGAGINVVYAINGSLNGNLRAQLTVGVVIAIGGNVAGSVTSVAGGVTLVMANGGNVAGAVLGNGMVGSVMAINGGIFGNVTSTTGSVILVMAVNGNITGSNVAAGAHVGSVMAINGSITGSNITAVLNITNVMTTGANDITNTNIRAGGRLMMVMSGRDLVNVQARGSNVTIVRAMRDTNTVLVAAGYDFGADFAVNTGDDTLASGSVLMVFAGRNIIDTNVVAGVGPGGDPTFGDGTDAGAGGGGTIVMIMAGGTFQTVGPNYGFESDSGTFMVRDSTGSLTANAGAQIFPGTTYSAQVL